LGLLPKTISKEAMQKNDWNVWREVENMKEKRRNQRAAGLTKRKRAFVSGLGVASR
jgi:hypothetical protein